MGVTLLAEDGRVRWIRPAGDEGACPPGREVADAGRTAIMPTLVDGHSVLHWRGGAPAARGWFHGTGCDVLPGVRS